MFVIKAPTGLYLANPIWRFRWTTNLIHAQFYLTIEEAHKARIKRDGEIVMVEIRECCALEQEGEEAAP